MIDLRSDVPTISTKDVTDVLRQFIDNGGYDNEELFMFASELTGVSVDRLSEEISEEE